MSQFFTEYLLKEDERDTGKIIKRELEVKAVKGKVISIIGPRRAGKTYFLYKLREKYPAFLHLNFEEPVLKGVEPKEIYNVITLYNEIFGRKPKTLFLDEVQNPDDWPAMVRSLLDREEFNIFIAGSSSKLLSREIAPQLRGRALSYVLLPFSFREFLRTKNMVVKRHMSATWASQKLWVFPRIWEERWKTLFSLSCLGV